MKRYAKFMGFLGFLGAILTIGSGARASLVDQLTSTGIYDQKNATAFVKGLNSREVKAVSKLVSHPTVVYSSHPVEWTTGR